MLYYTPAAEPELNLHLMKLIDEQYTKTPFYGWPRIRIHLRRLGYLVNHKRVRRLMQKMGLQALNGKAIETHQRTSKRGPPWLKNQLLFPFWGFHLIPEPEVKRGHSLAVGLISGEHG
jgi:putative transposase